MSELVEYLRNPTKKVRSRIQLRTIVTHSGLNIATIPTAKYNPAYVTEHILKLAGALMLPAGGLALLSPALFTPNLVGGALFWTGHLGLFAALGLVGIALHRSADRGFLRRVQVDAVRCEVRIGTINNNGDFFLRSTYSLASIESFFIVRSRSPRELARLRMRLKNASNTVDVVEGVESSLIPILERITLTLKPKSMRNRRVRTQTTGRFIRMTFD